MNPKEKNVPIWCLENITVPIVVRIGDFPNLILGEENNTWR